MSRFLKLLLAGTALTIWSYPSLAQEKRPAPPAPAASGTPAKPVKAQETVKADAARVGDPYPLDSCPITGMKLGSMGDPIVKIYDGREVRYCCEGCLKPFEKDLAASFVKLDEKMIKDQAPLYPLKTSVVTGKDLPAKPFEFVSGNRLVRLGSESEKAAFLKDAPKFLHALNKAATESQLKDYPLKTCPASQETLEGHEGKPVDLVLAGRLLRVCCKDCVKAVEKDPAKFIAIIDAARRGEKPKPDADPKNGSDKKSDNKGG